MITRSTLSSRSLATLAFAFVVGAATSAQAVTALSEPGDTITIYKPLGFAFGYTGATPSGLFGAFGGGGGGGGGGGFLGVGTMPQLNVGPTANFLAGPGGGGGGGGFVGGGNVPQANLGPTANFLAGPGGGGGGGGGGFVAGPTAVFQGGAAVVGGGEQIPQNLPGVNNLAVAQVPDAGVSTFGFGLVLAVLGLAARSFNRPLRPTARKQTT